MFYSDAKESILSLCTYAVQPKSKKTAKNVVIVTTRRPMMKQTMDDGKKKPAIFKFYDFTKGNFIYISSVTKHNEYMYFNTISCYISTLFPFMTVSVNFYYNLQEVLIFKIRRSDGIRRSQFRRNGPRLAIRTLSIPLE